MTSAPREVAIRRLSADEADAAVPALAALLVACVEGGASVSFMLPITTDTAEGFWRMVARDVRAGGRALLVAHDGDAPVGTVQLVLAMPENQPHRADVAKMLVHPSARRRGVAGRLMAAVEDVARDEGRTLLVLDTVTGGDAERLYARAGWQQVGVIPGFALMPDGAPCSTTYFFKVMGSSEGR